MSEDHVLRFGSIEIGGSPVRRTYRRVRWSPQRYQRAVVRQLRFLRSSRIGGIILSAITRRLLIVPWQDPDEDNAEARPMPSGQFIGFIPTSFPRDNRNGVMRGQWVDPNRPEAGLGTGRGSAVVIEYTPGMWVPGSPIATQDATRTRAQELLLHELVHAVRIMRGRADTRLRSYDFRKPNARNPLHTEARDEFHAVLITNIYRSERRVAPLRQDHRGWNPLRNPGSFYSQTHNKLMVMDLCREMQCVTRSIANVDCSFNPIREYYVEMGVIRP